MATRSSRPTHDHAEWMTPEAFDEAVKNFYGLKVLMFDKAFAGHVLSYNTGNRRINAGKLARLVGQMQRGEFMNTGEAVIMSAEGVLNDGQHRLQAVVEADAVVSMDVRFGIPRKAFVATDTGATRTPSDVLSISGVSHSNQIAQALRLLVLYERGLPDAIREFVSNEQVQAAWEKWPDIADIAERIQGRAFPKGVRSTPLYATAFLASRAQGKTRLDAWLETLETGLTAESNDPAYQLRERLMRGTEAAVGTREGQLERFALMLKSWNLFRKGESVSMREFRWKATGKGAEPFPSIAGAKL